MGGGRMKACWRSKRCSIWSDLGLAARSGHSPTPRDRLLLEPKCWKNCPKAAFKNLRTQPPLLCSCEIRRSRRGNGIRRHEKGLRSTTKHVIVQFYPTSLTRRRMGAPITLVPGADHQSVRAANRRSSAAHTPSRQRLGRGGARWVRISALASGNDQDFWAAARSLINGRGTRQMDVRHEIAKQVEALPPEMQERVLRFATSLAG